MDTFWNHTIQTFLNISEPLSHSLPPCLLSAEVKKQVPSIEEGEVLKPLMKCYTAIEVSSNKGDISRYCTCI